MSNNIIPFDKNKDSLELCSWWNSQGWDENTIHVVSDTGFVFVENDKNIAATWIIKTNSPIFLMEWTVGNPDVSWELRKKAIDKLTDFACKWSKEKGAAGLLVMTKNNRYIEKLKNNKFEESDKNMTHLIRSL